MLSTGIELNDLLKPQIQDLVPQEGILQHNEDHPYTIIFITIPICRHEGGSIEQFQSKAFLLHENYLFLGEKLGFLFQSPEDRKFYNDHLSNLNKNKDVDINIFPMEILQFNSKQDYQKQSGVQKQDDLFALIGLGALGSVLFDLWNRSGWGDWVLIDKDHIKPHNLTRHVAGKMDVGLNKALVSINRAHETTGNINENYVAYEENALALSNESRQAIAKSNLVIDASTTLDYPRQASFQDNNPRHCSVFITPDGNSAVLLIEDKNRNCRLRSLEAQYYRAIITQPWGEHHLDKHLGSFISGASCRDISLKLPFSTIMGHAATLSEQIMQLNELPNASIMIWHKDKTTGIIELFNYSASNEISFQVGQYHIFIDENLMQTLFAHRQEHLPNETGGILLGYFDLNLNALFIVDALPQPQDSHASETGFQRGVSGIMSYVNEAKRRTANTVDYIGEWHSHPVNTSSKQSHLDLAQLSELALLLDEDGMPAVQLIVSENDINILLGNIEND